MNKTIKFHKGFTLVELLVTMGIIAVLTGMAVFNFNQSRVRARDVSRKNDLSQIQKALELYKNDNDGLYIPETDFQDNLKTAGYIKYLFNDPRGSEWVTYEYLPSTDRKTYYLMACLENSSDQTKTTDTDICNLFNNSAGVCTCHTTNKGVMYTLSQP